MAGEIPAGLVAAGARVEEELRRADGKATTLLSMVGAAMASVIAVGAQGLPGAGAVLVWLSLVPTFASVTVLLAVIRPRLNRHPVRGTWLYAALVGPATLLASYEDTDVVSTASEVCTLARIALAKYRRIAVAVVLVLAGLATLVMALLLTAVTR